MHVFEKDGFRPASPYGDEYHQRLIVASRLETDRHVLFLSELMKNRRLISILWGSNAGLAGSKRRLLFAAGSRLMRGRSKIPNRFYRAETNSAV